MAGHQGKTFVAANQPGRIDSAGHSGQKPRIAPRPDPALTRKFFQIGYNRCGTTFIARLFRLNGIPAAHWEEGALAEDIAYAKLAGRVPLERWTDRIVAFTDMESVRYVNMPVVEAFKEYAFLDRSFPGAVFLLNTRRVEDWIASRYLHRGGSYARTYARIRGVAPADLADLWAAEWEEHLAGVRAHFAGRPEFVEIDIDRAAPQDYRDALAPFFDLPQCPDLPGPDARRWRAGYWSRLERMLAAAPPALPAARRTDLAGRLAAFARPAGLRQGAGEGDACSDRLVSFDAARGEIRDREGKSLPVRRGADGWLHLDPARLRWLEVAAAANDIAQVTDQGIYRLDMHPAPAAPPGQAVGGPVLAPGRRAGAENVFLWPMPRHHRPGNDAFLGDPQRADPPFADKLDLAFRCDAPEGDAPGRPDPLSHRYLICPGGAAGAGDFIRFANSNSVVLKEEDGWEHAFSGLFRPWEHYVPLACGAGDLAERLAWARAHPEECRAMSRAARDLCAALADPELRRAHLERVLADYRAASGQIP